MADYKGGYQIIDLSGVTVGTQATIAGVYNKAGSNNSKPIMIITPDGQRVFAEVKAGTNKYVTAYLGADGSTYTVEISNANKVDITKNESGAETDERLDDIEERLNATVAVATSVQDLTGYTTSSEPYTCPSEGYVRLVVGANSANNVAIASVDQSNQTFSLIKLVGNSGGTQYSCAYIHKGQKVFVESNEGTGNTAIFKPLV